MKSLRSLLNGTDGDLSAVNTPTSSIISVGGSDLPPRPVANEGRCALCGQRDLCGSMGYVRYEVPIEDERFGKLFRCPNYLGANTERREKLRKIGNLEAFKDKTFDTFRSDLPTLTAQQRQSLHMALAIARDYAANPHDWLLIEGGFGCGKTHLAAAIGNARLDFEDAVLFVTAPDLLDHLRSSFGADAETNYDEMFDRLKNAPLLILDDLGVENPSGWALEKLFQLLNYRYSRRIPTIITTNAPLDALDGRIRSRMLDDTLSRRISISAPDYRTAAGARQTEQISDLALYREMRFDNFDTTRGAPEFRANLERALAIARDYAGSPHGWLLLMGNYGSGKTHLAASIANEWQERGAEVVFVTVPDLLDYLRLAFSPSANTSFDRRFSAVRAAPYLILDDLGTESATGWAKEKLYQIINHRYVAQLPTVITTARELENLDERLQSRLRDPRRCTLFAITAPSYAARLARKTP